MLVQIHFRLLTESTKIAKLTLTVHRLACPKRSNIQRQTSCLFSFCVHRYYRVKKQNGSELPAFNMYLGF